MATPSLLSKVIKSQGQDIEIHPSGTKHCQVRMMKVRPSTQMVVFGIGDKLWFPS